MKCRDCQGPRAAYCTYCVDCRDKRRAEHYRRKYRQLTEDSERYAAYLKQKREYWHRPEVKEHRREMEQRPETQERRASLRAAREYQKYLEEHEGYAERSTPKPSTKGQ